MSESPIESASITAVSGTSGAAVSVAHAQFGTRIVDADAGRVEITPKRKKVAIVGFADSTRDLAPNEDPDWELWTLNQLYRLVARWTKPELQDRVRYPLRHFEIHTREVYLADVVRDTNYAEWLRSCPVPLYMGAREADIPNSVRFPIEAITAKFTAPHPLTPGYYQSTIAYQVALALFEGFEEIGIWGVDLVVGDEYFYQKCNLEWWLGLAQGLGVRVTLPERCALTKALYRYGYEKGPRCWPISMAMVEERRTALIAKRNELMTQINAVEGAVEDLNFWRHVLELSERGSTVLAT